MRKLLRAAGVFLKLSLCLLNIQAQPRALYFDGIDDYVNLDALSPALKGAAQFTIEFRMQADFEAQPQPGARVSLFAINDFSNSGNVLLFVMGGVEDTQEGKLVIADQMITPANFVIVSSEIIGDNTCHHIAYVRDGTEGKAYVDGQFIGSHTVLYELKEAYQYSLGQEWDWGVASDFYRGMIDELRVWDYARDDLAIRDGIFTILTGDEPGLVAWYDFEQGIPGADNTLVDTLLDRSGQGRGGRLENFALEGEDSNWGEDPCVWYDCQGILYGAAEPDTCGICLEPSDPSFNLPCPEALSVYIPDAFTPNGDGFNDLFRIYTEPGKLERIVRFSIFERWGGLVYESGPVMFPDDSTGWDGECQGKKAAPGIYVYRIVVVLSNGETRSFSGELSLIR